MGFDLGDILSAAGEGLGTYAGVKDDRRKEELAQKLEIEREQRQEQYRINAEERAQKRKLSEVSGDPELVTGDNGTVNKVYRNVNGEVIKSEPATQDDMENYNFARQKNKLTLEDLTTRIAGGKAEARYREAQADNAPNDFSLERALKESQIRENNAQAARAALPDSSTSTPEKPPHGLSADEYDYLVSARAELAKGVDIQKVIAKLQKAGMGRVAKELMMGSEEDQ